MKIRTIVYGTTFKKAKDFLETELYPKYKDKIIRRDDYENFIWLETEDEIVQTYIKGQMPSRCHKVFYDVEEDEVVLEAILFPLVSLNPVLENRVVPY